MRIEMPGVKQRSDNKSNSNSNSNCGNCGKGNGASLSIWSKHWDDIDQNQLQKFWNELPLPARQDLLRIDKQTLFEQARKNLYCSRCNGLLLEFFLQITMHGKSMPQVTGTCRRQGALESQSDSDSVCNQSQDIIHDPALLPWGGLTATRDGLLTFLDCYLRAKSLKTVQNVFDSAHSKERERELLYPDGCGGGNRGWISQGVRSYGRGHVTRETCALHTAKLSCDTLVDFWSALGEETRISLLRMKEEDFVERLMYRFEDKKFCIDCRKNVIREFRELKEMKRSRREPRCSSWFCVADTAFQYEVSADAIQADWGQTFSDNLDIYHHFEWGVGTGEGKSDVLEFEDVGLDRSVCIDGLDLRSLNACFITLLAWKVDGRCTEISVKAHALRGQECVHCHLVVGDGYVSIANRENMRRFFERAEEAEDEEDDDSMERDGNDLDGECSRPQKHAKSPELAREFLLDAATVIFKEQIEKAFREGTARQNAHIMFISLALQLLEERFHVACKEIITLEKQTKLLEEEEREKREEKERKERRKAKEKEKKQRRKERLKGKENDKGQNDSETNLISAVSDEVQQEETLAGVEEYGSNGLSHQDSADELAKFVPSRYASPDTRYGQPIEEYVSSNMQDDSKVSATVKGGPDYTAGESKFTGRRQKYWKDVQVDPTFKWPDQRQYSVASGNNSTSHSSELRYYGDNCEIPSGAISRSTRQGRFNSHKSSTRSSSVSYGEKFSCSSHRMSDRYDSDCSCNRNNEHKAKARPHFPVSGKGWEAKSTSKPESAMDITNHFHHNYNYSRADYIYDGRGRPRSKFISGNIANKDSAHYFKKVWEPLEAPKKYPRSNPDSGVSTAMRASGTKVDGAEAESNNINRGDAHSSEVSGNSDDNNCVDNDLKGSNNPCYIKESAEELVGVNSLKKSTIISAHQSSNSNCDNCSSCLSEGDSNTASSNHNITESSSTSDSEDVRQVLEETMELLPKVYIDCLVENNQRVNGEAAYGNRTPFDCSQNGVVGNLTSHPQTQTAHHYENGQATDNMDRSPAGLLPRAHNSFLPFPMYQGLPAMTYYQQPQISWPTAPADGFLQQFPHPNQYMYTGLLGYDLNRSSGLYIPYERLQDMAAPRFNTARLPVYQPVSSCNSSMTPGERHTFCEPGVAEEHTKGAKAELIGVHSMEASSKQEEIDSNRPAQKHDNNAGFSLFHFGGPVGLSTGSSSDPIPTKDEISEELSSKFPSSPMANNNSSNKPAEEYSLFDENNGIKFSLF